MIFQHSLPKVPKAKVSCYNCVAWHHRWHQRNEIWPVALPAREKNRKTKYFFSSSSATDIVYRNTCQKHEAMFRLLDNSFDNARLTEIRKFENLTSYSANFLNAIIGLDLLKKTVWYCASDWRLGVENIKNPKCRHFGKHVPFCAKINYSNLQNCS